MNREELIAQIRQKKSFLCVGLDTDLSKIPAHILKEKDPIFEFNRRIIDATHSLAVAYKPNLAFYECLGTYGWEALERTLAYIPKNIFSIADAKRGDIGNTSAMYAKALLEQIPFDSITVAPYMGEDSIKPFLSKEGKWVIVLALTSNQGAFDFQTQELANGKLLFEEVLEKTAQFGHEGNMMFVVGATKAEMLEQVRTIVPNHFLLVPGVGSQGGSLKEVCKYGLNKDIGLLVNSSRNILYASQDEHFEKAALKEAFQLQQEMAILMEHLT